MPELPEVEAVCRRLRQDARAATITSAHFPRPGIVRPQSASSISHKLAGRQIDGVRRRGKNILIDLSCGLTLHVHLRMTGNLYVIPDYRLRPLAARAWFELADGRAIIFDDPRALGRIQLHATDEIESLLKDVGIEPLSDEFTEAVFLDLARSSRKPVKLFLLDQSYVAGIGNIYAAEALYEARIDPRKLTGSLSAVRLRRLHSAIVGILSRAVQSACIAYMHPGRFQEAEWFPVKVYDREGESCGVCQRTIRRMEQGGRSTYFCPGCQR